MVKAELEAEWYRSVTSPVADSIDIAPNTPINVGHNAQQNELVHPQAQSGEQAQGQKLQTVLCNPDTTLSAVIIPDVGNHAQQSRIMHQDVQSGECMQCQTIHCTM